MAGFLPELLRVLSIEDTSSSHATLQAFWRLDVEFELLTRSDECSRSKAATCRALALCRLVRPLLLPLDYVTHPFAVPDGDEIILVRDPGAEAAALRLARRWVEVVGF